MPDGREYLERSAFELLPSRDVVMKGLGTVAVREVHNTGMHFPSLTAENRALDGLHALYDNNRYWPRWEHPEPSGGEWSHVTPLDEPDK
jgi:hypothetical protein